MTHSVRDTSQPYDEMAALWRLPVALMGGTRAMRRARETYLPRAEAETVAAYEARLGRSILFNAFGHAVKAVTGRVFAKPLVLGDSVPDDIRGWCENADLQGQRLSRFARGVFQDGLVKGLSHILIDMLPARPGVTLADERAAGVRPYLVHVPAERLIGWRAETVDGRRRLTQVRILEDWSEPASPHGERTGERVRVLFPGGFQVWHPDDSGAWELVEEGETSLDEIPLVTFYANRADLLRATPPLEDLAWLNLAHWQSQSDQRHILHVARVPILLGTGFGEESRIEIGPNRLIKAPMGSELKFVEHSGSAIAAGRQDLADLEDQMRMMGLEPLLPRAGNQTATAKAIDTAEAHSMAQDWALGLENTLAEALGAMARWTGRPGTMSGAVRINTRLGPSPRDASDVDALIQARRAGEISRATLWRELKRRNFLAEDFDPAREADA